MIIDLSISYTKIFIDRQVAILCNHQRAVPKTFDQSMQKLQEKKKQIKSELKELEAGVKAVCRLIG